jgi:hypothetical protein
MGLTTAGSSMVHRIFENIIFLEEVFVGRADGELPDVPLLELARSFELKSVNKH